MSPKILTGDRTRTFKQTNKTNRAPGNLCNIRAVRARPALARARWMGGGCM
jgi:hypothetical protein